MARVDELGATLKLMQTTTPLNPAARALIAGAIAKLRGTEALAEQSAAEPYPFHCSKCGVALTFDKHVCNAVEPGGK